jgi:hypothetical protein
LQTVFLESLEGIQLYLDKVRYFEHFRKLGVRFSGNQVRGFSGGRG